MMQAEFQGHALPHRPHHGPAYQGRRQLSYRRVDTAAALPQCIDTLMALRQRPDIAVVTGANSSA